MTREGRWPQDDEEGGCLPVLALAGHYPTNKLIGRRPLFWWQVDTTHFVILIRQLVEKNPCHLPVILRSPQATEESRPRMRSFA